MSRQLRNNCHSTKANNKIILEKKMLNRTPGYKIIQFLTITGSFGNTLPPLYEGEKSAKWIWNIWWWTSFINVLLVVMPLLLCYFYTTTGIEWFEVVTQFSIAFKIIVVYIFNKVHSKVIKVSLKLSEHCAFSTITAL